MRTDPHTETQLNPENYDLFGVYLKDSNTYIGHIIREQKLLNAIHDLEKQGIAPAPHQEPGVCGHCGQPLIYCAILIHRPTKTYIFVGETCLGDRFSMSKKMFDLARKERRDLRAGIVPVDREKMLADNIARAVEFDAVLEVLRDEEMVERLSESNYVVSDIYRFMSKKQASEKQLKLLSKEIKETQDWWARQEEEQKKYDQAKPVEAGKGVVIRGVVLAKKWVENDYGSTLKMLVETVDGWKCWGSEPSSLSGVEVGEQVEFVANVSVSEDDAKFGFFARPRKGKVL